MSFVRFCCNLCREFGCFLTNMAIYIKNVTKNIYRDIFLLHLRILDALTGVIVREILIFAFTFSRCNIQKKLTFYERFSPYKSSTYKNHQRNSTVTNNNICYNLRAFPYKSSTYKFAYPEFCYNLPKIL